MRGLQKKVLNFVKRYKLGHSPEVSALDLVSEIGEVAKEILKSTKYGKEERGQVKEMKSEIGDSFYSLINLANTLNVDLEDALNLALKKYEARLQKSKTPESGA